MQRAPGGWSFGWRHVWQFTQVEPSCSPPFAYFNNLGSACIVCSWRTPTNGNRRGHISTLSMFSHTLLLPSSVEASLTRSYVFAIYRMRFSHTVTHSFMVETFWKVLYICLWASFVECACPNQAIQLSHPIWALRWKDVNCMSMFLAWHCMC